MLLRIKNISDKFSINSPTSLRFGIGFVITTILLTTRQKHSFSTDHVFRRTLFTICHIFAIFKGIESLKVIHCILYFFMYDRYKP